MKCHCYYVFFLHFFFIVVNSFSLHAMLPLLANKDEYIEDKTELFNICGNFFSTYSVGQER